MRDADWAVVVDTQVVIVRALVGCGPVARAETPCVLRNVGVSSAPVGVVVDALRVDNWELFVGSLLLEVEGA